MAGFSAVPLAQQLAPAEIARPVMVIVSNTVVIFSMRISFYDEIWDFAIEAR